MYKTEGIDSDDEESIAFVNRIVGRRLRLTSNSNVDLSPEYITKLLSARNSFLNTKHDYGSNDSSAAANHTMPPLCSTELPTIPPEIQPPTKLALITQKSSNEKLPTAAVKVENSYILNDGISMPLQEQKRIKANTEYNRKMLLDIGYSLAKKGLEQLKVVNSKISEIPEKLVSENIDEHFELCKENYEEMIKEEQQRVQTLRTTLLNAPAIKICRKDVLVHSSLPLLTHFKAKRQTMHNLSEINQTQIIAWPHVLNGNSLFVMNGPQTGRTWCYLPMLCKLIAQKMLHENSNIEGPLALIVVPSVPHAQLLTTLCISFLQANKISRTSNGVLYVSNKRECEANFEAIIKSCSILVTTIIGLKRLLEIHVSIKPLFNEYRLKHLVFDDIDDIRDLYPELFDSVLHCILHLLFSWKVTHDRKLEQQLIITTKSWISSFFSEVILYGKNMALLFGDFMDALVYGDVTLTYRTLRNEEKFEVILRELAKFDEMVEQGRKIIFCKTRNDIYAVHQMLHSAGYDSLVCMENINYTDTINEWKNQTKQILVCDDKTFSDLKVFHAHFIIHYTLPDSWDTFKKRHSALVFNYENLFDVVPNKKTSTIDLEVLILVEPKSSEAVRFDLIEWVNNEKERNDAPLILIVCQNQNTFEPKLDKISSSLFCDYLFTFGECLSDACNQRHTLERGMDLLTKEQSNYIPVNGKIQCAVLNVYTPTHYSVRLLRHLNDTNADGDAIGDDETNWSDLTKAIAYENWQQQINSYYTTMDDLQLYWPPKLNEICIFKYNDAVNYQRVRVVNVPTVLKSMSDTKVSVKLLDANNDKIDNVPMTSLWMCAAQFLTMPPFAIELRLTGIVPKRHNLFLKTIFNLQERFKVNNILEGRIHLSLSHTIFVETLFVLKGTNNSEEVKSKWEQKEPKWDLKDFLLGTFHGYTDNIVSLKLHAMIESEKQKNSN